jgi:hypothetical protein
MIRIVSCLGFGACSRRRLDRRKSVHWDFSGRLSALLGGGQLRRLLGEARQHAAIYLIATSLD